MNFGLNLFNWLSVNIQYLVLAALLIMALVFIGQRKTTELVVTIIVGIFAVGFAFNTAGAKDVMLAIFNKIIASS